MMPTSDKSSRRKKQEEQAAPDSRCQKTGQSRQYKEDPPAAHFRNSISRIATVAVFTSLEVVIIGVLIIRLGLISLYLRLALGVLALFVVLAVCGRRINAAYKISWLVFIMVLPVFGTGLYLTMGTYGVNNKARKRLEKSRQLVSPFLVQSSSVARALSEDNPSIAREMSYVWKYAHFPVYQNTAVRYFKDPVDGIADQVRELEKARHFIFMEYYAIQETETFAPILKVLSQKAADGLDVRLIYDDIGSGSFITTDFITRMEKLGIRCRVANHVGYIFRVIMNNRDHRKITVIDGETGYTGGYNLADLYTHKVEPYGFWKDTGVRLQGDAVRSLTAMFLSMWNAIGGKGNDDIPADDKHPEAFFTTNVLPAGEGMRCDPRQDSTNADCRGFVQPYADSPLDNELVAENVYINILNTATKYCYFVTPYLLITDEMGRAFELAAKRGVDVRIITPGKPDKAAVYQLTRSYYHGLVENGVRIFEYTPGFCHAKMCLSDDAIAAVGTINLDYRSLYLHFEDSCLMYKTECIPDICQDFEEMLNASTEVTKKYKEKQSVPLQIGQSFLRIFAPLV